MYRKTSSHFAKVKKNNNNNNHFFTLWYVLVVMVDTGVCIGNCDNTMKPMQTGGQLVSDFLLLTANCSTTSLPQVPFDRA